MEKRGEPPHIIHPPSYEPKNGVCHITLRPYYINDQNGENVKINKINKMQKRWKSENAENDKSDKMKKCENGKKVTGVKKGQNVT